MEYEQRRGGIRYVVGAFGQDQAALEALRNNWPGALAPQWEGRGVVVRTLTGTHHSPPCWVVWRPSDVDSIAPIDVDETPVAGVPTSCPLENDKPLTHTLLGTTKYKNLTRIEIANSKNRPGYLVRLQWGKERRGRFFADATHGGRLGALAAALEWRDQMERELDKPHTLFHVTGAATSNTGLVGITRTMKGGHSVFQVTWYEEGRQRRRVFNIDLLGEQQALTAAKKARDMAERARLRQI